MNTKKIKLVFMYITCFTLLMTAKEATAQINLNKIANKAKSVVKDAAKDAAKEMLKDDEKKVEEKTTSPSKPTSPTTKSTPASSDNSKPASTKETVSPPAKSSSTSSNVSSTKIPAGTKTLYVSMTTGNNRNDGSKEAPYKNLQKAIDEAPADAVILVAEGNYFGTLNSGNINIKKAVKIYGGFTTDFSKRDILTHLTMVQPTPESNGTQNGQGTVQIQVKEANTEVVIDGIIFDRGNSIAYNSRGDGKPEGVESPMMQPIGAAGIGGEKFSNPQVYTTQTAIIYLENPRCDLTVNNCAFLNAPNYGIRGMFGGSKATINNCIFINNRMAACEITKGGIAVEATEVHFSNNTVLFSWSRLKDLGDMGYGYRYMTGLDSYVTNNIIGLSTFAGIDRTRIDSDKTKEAKRITTAENNIFFFNRQADLTLPGGGKFMRIWVADFDDVDQLAKSSGNKTLNDPKIFKGKINEAYLNGFLSVAYKEDFSYDPNSSVNTFRSAMGMNQTGTIQSSVSMYANNYPWKEALNFFGAIDGYGAQMIK